MNASTKFLIAALLIVLVAGAGYWAWQKQSGDDLANLSANAGTKLTDDQVARIVSRVGQFMVLPQDEQPSVVIIRDAAGLAEKQPFYKGSKDGDILIVYPNRAVIYDPKNDKLVNAGQLVRSDATPTPEVTASGSVQLSPSPSGTPPAPEKVTVDVLNGTSIAGLAGSTASDLGAKGTGWFTRGRLGDAKGAFTKTVIVDLSKGTKPGAVAKLKELLSAEVVTALPAGEAASTADIVVIVGK